MIGQRRIPCMMAVFALITSTVVSSQERETVSVAELHRVFDMVKSIAEEISEQRQEMDSEESTKLFLQTVVEYQKLLVPVIVLIAETDAPREAQLYAISVAIAAKETELALWHYINAFLIIKQKYLDSADLLLRESLDELSRAASLAPGGE